MLTTKLTLCLILVQVSVLPGERSVCYPCYCFPDIDLQPSLLYCQGYDIYDFPLLSPTISKHLRNIYVFSTNIECVAPLLNKDDYSSLVAFTEDANAQWNCTCLENWYYELASQVNFTTSCSLSTTSLQTTFSSSPQTLTHPFSTIHSSTEKSTSFSFSTEHPNPTSSHKPSLPQNETLSSTSPFPDVSTAVENSSSQIDGEKNGQKSPIYIAALGAAAVAPTAAVAAVYIFNRCKNKGLCPRSCRRRRLARGSRRLHDSNNEIRLRELDYHVNELCSEV